MEKLSILRGIISLILVCQMEVLCAEQHAPFGLPTPKTAGFANSTVHVSRGGSALCVSGMIGIEARTTQNLKLDLQQPANQSTLSQLWVSLWSAGSDLKDSITLGTQNAGGSFQIASTLCTPSKKIPKKVQILTHGIGFDQNYWDFAPGYSYVDVAAEYGMATFFYDRLGIGQSSKPDPIQTIQSALQVEVLHSLTLKLRKGAIGGSEFSSIVGVGHSFGSAITQGLTATYPQAIDAVVLTGFSINGSSMAPFSIGQNIAIASENQPYRFSALPSAFTVIDQPISTQLTFFHAPGFDPNILSLAESTKATTTLGEYLTTGTTVKLAKDFDGPVAVVDGHEDFGFCGGNCTYPTNLLEEVTRKLYPKVPKSKKTTYLAPNTGHGLNLHYSANTTFTFIQEFLTHQGL